MSVAVTVQSVPITVTVQDQPPISVTIGGVSVGNLPIGGTTGQVLTKNSDLDYDTIWVSSVDPFDGGDADADFLFGGFALYYFSGTTDFGGA